MTQKRINKKYKDSLFRMIFREKKELLSLYNAINGSDYQDPEALIINTLEDVVYMSIKNDTSFILDDYLSLYEAQSTVNPNMPLRGLFYFAWLYQGYIDLNELNVYSSRQIPLPTPRYVVFYNGPREQEEKKLLNLSDCFIKQSGTEPPSLECTALFLNINYGYNKELMTKCRKLYEYSYLVDTIRTYQREGNSLENAVQLAVQQCIDQGILVDFLRKHRGEVMDLILTEYNEELHIRDEKNISYEEGHEDGRMEGIEEGIERGILALIETLQELSLPRDQAAAKLAEKFSLTAEAAESYLKRYWNM